MPNLVLTSVVAMVVVVMVVTRRVVVGMVVVVVVVVEKTQDVVESLAVHLWGFGETLSAISTHLCLAHLPFIYLFHSFQIPSSSCVASCGEKSKEKKKKKKKSKTRTRRGWTRQPRSRITLEISPDARLPVFNEEDTSHVRSCSCWLSA